MHKGEFIEVKLHSRLMHWYRWQKFKLPLFNTVARMAMQFKFTFDPIWLKYQMNENAVDSNDVERLQTLSKNKHLFFGLSTFRSGSTFLTDMLTQELKEAQIEHEPNVNDYWSYTKVLFSEQHALDYLQEYRCKDILHRFNFEHLQVYGELNPFLVLHSAALQKLLPNAIYFHLLRDGRSVVRSLMAREILGDKDPLLKVIRPPQNDPYYGQWDTMSRFEKVCWKWQYENQILRQNIDNKIHFEQLINSYDYFKNHLLDLLNIEISEERWAYHIAQPKHATPRYNIGHWKDWSNTQKKQFEKICGTEMELCGYP